MNEDPAQASVRVYRMLLVLLPRSFRDEFGYEMMCDFVDATRRARNRGVVTGLVSIWAWHAADLAKTMVVQWLRTGVPSLVAIAATWSLLLFALLALQSIPPMHPRFAQLHFAWVVAGCGVLLSSIALGRYHSRHSR